MKEIEINDVYQHYKGELYIVTNIITDAEEGNRVIVYKQLLFIDPFDKSEVYCHSEVNFNTLVVTRDNESVKRFQYKGKLLII